MIRPISVVCMLMAGGSGLYLYQTKHRALLLDREITHTVKQTEVARERITALRAEWALLNEPERLSELNAHHLGLRTLSPAQFVALSDLAARLPAPLPPGAVVLPEPSEEVAVNTPEPVSAPVRTAMSNPGSRTVPPAPAITTAAATPAPAVTTVAAAPLRPLRTARRDDPARPAGTVTTPTPATTSPATTTSATTTPATTVAAAATPTQIAQAQIATTPIAQARIAQVQIAQAQIALAPNQLAPRMATVQAVAARGPIVLAPPRAPVGGPMLTQTPSPIAPGTVGESVQRASSLGTAHASALAAPTPYTGR